ncbi:uncharacterized protein LOC121781826 [Salvia splendens]|uniref:uncharacterized protein LOC121781826 n=1 Tax=Salvia splendens TaxID=180675 RepID=UPI001C2670AE|nr:uncharacterized protein LOC121781826 [Salvia splendens]
MLSLLLFSGHDLLVYRTPSMGGRDTISIFLWRLLANRIPVDTKMQWRRISLASMCRCCKSPQVESWLHLFVNGEAARRVWQHFVRWFPQVPAFGEAGENMELRFRWWQRQLGVRSGFEGGSGMEVEVSTVLLGVILAKQHGSRIWIESDAQRVVRWLSEAQLGPAEVCTDLMKIRKELQGLGWKVSHIFREGNKAADFHAGIGVQSGARVFYSRSSAPS